MEARGFSQEETQDFYRVLEGGEDRWTPDLQDDPRGACEEAYGSAHQAVQVEVELLPRSVLLSRGWDDAALDRFEREHSEEYGCEVYRVPTRKLTWSEVFESVQEQLLEQEKGLSMTRAQAKKSDMDVPVMEATTAGQKGGTSAEKAAEQAAKRLQTQNQKVAQEVGKWIAPLRKLPDSLGKVVKQVQSPGAHFHGTKEDLDLLEDLVRKAQAWGGAASRALLLDQQNADAQKAGVAATPLEPLPYTAAERRLPLCGAAWSEDACGL